MAHIWAKALMVETYGGLFTSKSSSSGAHLTSSGVGLESFEEPRPWPQAEVNTMSDSELYSEIFKLTAS